ncbi:hypothetical protein BV22DRAFT_1033433 [Leucogyrophana mollusca]|uniref:Uncharacterized protein n=1 Tax=Leucogyrophana mollusca TaxID=85980 RepID=A0ACB8BM59_9AGAM|nr:hypothetical protein BV22DRAFT_1033433 [Leucogyrophana mollusca]
MPHPSNPLDDICAHSFNREHGFASVKSRGRLVRTLLGCLRLSDSEPASWVSV